MSKSLLSNSKKTKSVLTTSKSSKSVLGNSYTKPSMGKGSCCVDKGFSKSGEVNNVISGKFKK